MDGGTACADTDMDPRKTRGSHTAIYHQKRLKIIVYTTASMTTAGLKKPAVNIVIKSAQALEAPKYTNTTANTDLTCKTSQAHALMVK